MKFELGMLRVLNESRKCYGHTRMYYNMETQEVWVRVFNNSTDYIKYDNKNIIEVNNGLS